MSPTPRSQSLAQFFRILGDPSRLRILSHLGKTPMNVTQICRTMRMSQPTVSRHLGILKMSALAESERRGKEMFYSIPAGIRRKLKSILEHGESILQ